MPARYEIRLRDRPGSRWADSFQDLEVRADGGVLVLSGELDQSALHGLLERARVLRLELLDVRRIRSAPRREPGRREPPGRSRPRPGEDAARRVR